MAAPRKTDHCSGLDTKLDLPLIQDAAMTIRPLVHRTPVLRCQAIETESLAAAHSVSVTHRELFFKCELFQKTGSFKVRGALNAVAHLPPTVTDVVTHSSGNHAQALAWAARAKGLNAHIVMPRTAPAVKVKAVKGYGGKVYLCEPTVEARWAMAAELVGSTGGALVHPSDDYNVMAGQGTVALEFLEQVKEETGGEELDALIIPIGGGGLLGGMAVAAKTMRPDIKIIGAEPAVVDDAARSKATGVLCLHPTPPPRSIADGLLTVLGKKTFPIVSSDKVDAILTVSEREIARAMRLVYERMKLVIEPSAGVGVAVALSCKKLNAVLGMECRRVGIVLCGGNVDISEMEEVWRLAAEEEEEEEREEDEINGHKSSSSSS
ncbi:serine racemase [Nannochloropsis oceanica]